MQHQGPSAILARAMALLSRGKHSDALISLRAAHARFPKDFGIAIRHADAAHLCRKLDEAIGAYRGALELNAASVEAWYGLGCAQMAQRAFGAAVEALEAAVALAPDAGGILYNLGKGLFELGHVDDAIDRFRQAAAAGDPVLTELAYGSIACIIPGSDRATDADILQGRRDWARREAEKLRRPTRNHPARASGAPLRIGYLSAFFGARNWMKPVWGLINHHDRARFEIHMFSQGGAPSPESGYRDRDRDYIHNITGVSNERAAEIVAGAGIDILVDLNGYSVQNRLPLMMLRPAPVIVGWFNMFATTGMEDFDWLVGDAEAIQPAEERHYVERVHRLPGTYLAFEVLYAVPDLAPPPSLRSGEPFRLAFGCLASQYKLTDRVLAAWGRILRAVPSAELTIGNAALGEQSTRDALLARLGRYGVEADRITLQGPAEHFEFLRTYDRIDIALDTFPYNGGTTTTEALWQGVPVLSFGGDRWAGRTSRSILAAAGLSDWVMADEESYVQRAIALAHDPDTPAMLAALRAGLRERLRSSPACDTAGLCRAMESFYERIAADAASRLTVPGGPAFGL